MGGWKTVRGVTLCSKPCCAGYEERQVRAPFLVSPVVCHKLTPEELAEREEARMTTTTPSPQSAAPLLLDQPRRFVRAASLYRAFLYRHRHMFLGLLREGFSRKELLAILERFLETVAPSEEAQYYTQTVDRIRTRALGDPSDPKARMVPLCCILSHCATSLSECSS
ncbi:hypothetical protein E2C01_064025 [Portunus trituberculatus]|uniref:Uncharacterized protein n=1 Tax=Portunus trituberculatus TaxID=210409 RepID=A0A5B7HMM5_PORTR|nr:hypothetical protein [Portunus trituberculatus]